MVFESAEPHAGKHWTDSGQNRDLRQLKHRERGESRSAPIPPPLTLLLNEHIKTYDIRPGARLFFGERNKDELPLGTIVRLWRWTRADVFSEAVAASPLAETPYSFRHACVSTWLNAGVPPTQVAEWAGHSVEVLLRTYAKCLDGGTAALQRQVDQALGTTAGVTPKLQRVLGANFGAPLA
jgi:integrase